MVAQKTPQLNMAAAAARAQALAWWDKARRRLPWRAQAGVAPDPYRVWLSEILLQQTTVEAATPYIQRFAGRWPSLEDLADASVEEVVDEFAGLGYYSRARNLHACARRVMAMGGQFPSDFAELRRLPGIGDYTAAAVAAIAFGQNKLPIDANIRRILCRYFGVERLDAPGRRRLGALADLWAEGARPGDFAQGLMDLGAAICRPQAPKCAQCPIGQGCVAAKSDPAGYPMPVAKKPRKRRFGSVYFAYGASGQFLVARRARTGLLAGTLELPGDVDRPNFSTLLEPARPPFSAPWEELPGHVEHVFTHFHLRLKVHRAPLDPFPLALGRYFALGPDDGSLARLPSVMAKAVRHARR